MAVTYYLMVNKPALWADETRVGSALALGDFAVISALASACCRCPVDARVALRIEMAALPTDEQIAVLREQGFVARGFADAGRVAALRALSERHLRDHVAPIEYEADLRYPGARTAPGRGAADRAPPAVRLRS